MEIITRSFNFFLELVQRTFRRQRIPKDEDIERYIAELLERSLRDEGKFYLQPLRIRLWELVQESPGTRLTEIKEIGDASLITAGIFAPHMTRRILGARYYIDVGECAYRVLFFSFHAENEASHVYEQLSRDLRPFARALREISREYFFRASMDDIARVSERYMLRGAEEDRQWLLERGVTILPEFTDVKKRIIV